MSDENRNGRRTAGIRIEGNDDVTLDGVTASGFDEGIVASDNKKISAKDIRVELDAISDDELENFKEELASLESAIEELKGEKDPKAWEKVIDKLSPLASKLFISYLKSQGYVE